MPSDVVRMQYSLSFHRLRIHDTRKNSEGFILDVTVKKRD